MTVAWMRCEGSQWCNLLHLDLSHPHFGNLEGVYIVWHGGPGASVVRVGQGLIRERLSSHRADPQILAFAENGLFATWAAVSHEYRDGVERFLAEKLRPKIGSAFPEVVPIQVNLPWG